MGKFVGFVGTISGKVGTTVFCKGEKGVSYGRAYQPQVNNPKTALQLDQRAKMNLVGKMSQVTPKGLLVGMSGMSARSRRSVFTRILLNAATIDRSVPGEILAQLAPEDIVFSQGAEIIAASAAVPAVTATGLTIALTLTDSSLAGRYGERIVVALVDPSNKAGYSAVVYKDQLFSDTTAQTVSISFGTTIADQTLVCIYRLPFVLNDEGAAVVYQSLANNSTNIVAKVVEGSNALVRGWGNSVLAATVLFTQA